jgi:hypothetical protein
MSAPENPGRAQGATPYKFPDPASRPRRKERRVYADAEDWWGQWQRLYVDGADDTWWRDWQRAQGRWHWVEGSP